MDRSAHARSTRLGYQRGECRTRGAFTLVTIVAVFTWSSLAIGAGDESSDVALLPLSARVGNEQLSEVRGGQIQSAVPPNQPIGVILWDELRIPPPPVRESFNDARVTASMNVQKP
jgi:hypothetical protein